MKAHLLLAAITINVICPGSLAKPLDKVKDISQEVSTILQQTQDNCIKGADAVKQFKAIQVKQQTIREKWYQQSLAKEIPSKEVTNDN